MLEAQKIIDAISDGIYIADREGLVVLANEAWIRRIKIPFKRVIGRNITDLLREYYFSAQCLEDDGADWAMREREYEHTVFPRVMASGDTVTDFFVGGRIITTGTPIFDERGEISHVLAHVRDQTVIPDYDEMMIKSLSGADREPLPGGRMLGSSPELEHIRILISEVAATDATVLITGETGVGKEVVAAEIQKNSRRADKPYIKVNCAAIPESLVEAELFGYEAGAFTGASRSGKAGLLEAANQGTVLLDEISQLPLHLQPKLLRAIQERMITRVGGVKPVPIDVRIIAATNENLKELVDRQQFREDLYYRLNVIPIYVPPLRRRGSDIEPLAKSFLREYNEKYGRSKVFSRGAIQTMDSYAWPGNIRELRNLVERLTVLGTQKEIGAPRVQRFLNWKGDINLAAEQQISLKEATRRLEYNMIEAALLRHGSTYKAAEALGTSQSTLIRKAKNLGISTGSR